MINKIELEHLIIYEMEEYDRSLLPKDYFNDKPKYSLAYIINERTLYHEQTWIYSEYKCYVERNVMVIAFNKGHNYRIKLNDQWKIEKIEYLDFDNDNLICVYTKE